MNVATGLANSDSMAGDVLARWNELDASLAVSEVLPCCGSYGWAEGLVARRPFATAKELFEASDMVWQGLSAEDWREAFDSHPRIGQTNAKAATERSLAWSGKEQSLAATAEERVKQELAEANRAYEERFGRIFIVCATGKTAEEILAIVRERMKNDAVKEMLEAAEQQRQITQIRLRRWLGVDR